MYQTIRLAAIGVPAGILLALGAARVFTSTNGNNPFSLENFFDVPAYVVGVLVVVAASLVASCFPARHAACSIPSRRFDLISVGSLHLES